VASAPFCQLGGCTLKPGTGSVLVMGMDTTFSIDGDGDGKGNLEETYTEVVEGVDVIRTLVTGPGEGAFVVREQTASGASVYLSGGMFAADDALDPGGANPWDDPNGNGTLMEAILDIRPQTVALKTIAQARDAAQGETVRTRGYVTVGTAVEVNRFPGMIYIQDDTAGLSQRIQALLLKNHAYRWVVVLQCLYPDDTVHQVSGKARHSFCDD
jgi:hypothetical protein